MVSRPAGKQGAGHMTDSSLPETAPLVNRPAPDFSTAAEPPAPPRLTTDEARRACGTTAITVCKDETDNYGLYQKRRPLVSSARENPHNGGKSLNYGDTAGGSFIHSSRRQEAFTTIAETAATVNRPAPDFSTAAEPPAPPRQTPDEARRACGTGTL